MTFGQILDLYIYKLKKEFKIINNLCETDHATLGKNNEKLANMEWDDMGFGKQ